MFTSCLKRSAQNPERVLVERTYAVEDWNSLRPAIFERGNPAISTPEVNEELRALGYLQPQEGLRCSFQAGLGSAGFCTTASSELPNGTLAQCNNLVSATRKPRNALLIHAGGSVCCSSRPRNLTAYLKNTRK